MIKDFLKNFCLITFALIGPITLPAGGIQRSLNEFSFLNSKEIILSANRCLYTCPKINAKKLMVIDAGTSLSILRKWQVKEKDLWIRVEIATNKFIENPNSVTKGWIKI